MASRELFRESMSRAKGWLCIREHPKTDLSNIRPPKKATIQECGVKMGLRAMCRCACRNMGEGDGGMEGW